MKDHVIKHAALYGTMAATAGVILALAGCTNADPIDNGSSPSVTTGGESSMIQPSEQVSSLMQVRYSRSGDSLGNMYYIETDVDEEGTPIVRVADSPRHDVRADIAEYRMPDGLLDRINAIADEAGIKTWGDLPMGDLFPLDAATPVLTLVYAPEDPDDILPVRMSITAWDEFPEGGEDAFNAIRDELSASIIPENRIRTYLEPEREP